VPFRHTRILLPENQNQNQNRMKLHTRLLIGATALALATSASAQTVVNLTGATAFRAASNNTILQLLGGPGVTEYAFTGSQGLNGSNRALFRGNLNGDPEKPYIVRTSWSGSTQGILDLADQNPVQVLHVDTVTSVTGERYDPDNGFPAPTFETAVPRWSFSDVDQLLSQRPNTTFLGGPVGVVPFMFVAGQSAPATMTNMTDQLHNTLWSVGALPVSMFTGDEADTDLAYPTGRNNGSGTRATILAETQYGAFTPVFQWNATFTGPRVPGVDGEGNPIPEGEITGSPFLFPDGDEEPEDASGNGGHSSNSGVRELLTRPSDGFFFVSYLTISDALASTGYNPVTNTISGGEGAKPMTYNGQRYSVDNVKNGSYTLWGYQQLYLAADATPAEEEFDTALRAAVPSNMGTAGIPIPDMNSVREGGDGGPVFPKDPEED